MKISKSTLDLFDALIWRDVPLYNTRFYSKDTNTPFLYLDTSSALDDGFIIQYMDDQELVYEFTALGNSFYTYALAMHSHGAYTAFYNFVKEFGDVR